MTPEALDSLSKQELIALVLALMEQNRQIQVLAEQNKALAARVAELEAKLNIPPKTPGNSSLPPSKGQKANKPEKAKKRAQGPAWRCAQAFRKSGPGARNVCKQLPALRKYRLARGAAGCARL